jgi:MFS family permease
MTLFTFARRNARALTFGALHSFYSSPGQTFVIGLFVVAVGDALGISATEIGVLYLIATLGSSAILIFVGYWIDHIRLVHFSAAVVVGLAIACFVMAAATSQLLLLAAFFLLRLTGQGLMSHVEATATARTFDTARGRALSITALGVPLAELVFPPLAIIGIAVVGWRWTYLVMGLIALLVILPVTQWLLRTFKRAPPGMTKPEGEGQKLIAGLLGVVRSRYVLLIIPVLGIFPFHMTAVMFHISTIVADKSWSPSLLAVSFPVMAIVTVVGLVFSGHVIDRITARRLVPYTPLPLLAGIGVLAASDADWALPVSFALLGLSSGLARTTLTAVWAELFGVRSLGAIRSAVSMFFVFVSGVAPFIFGLGLDFGLSVSTTLWLMVAYGVLALIPAIAAQRLSEGELTA